MLPVNDVILFVDVVRLKSFAKAAAHHSITSAAVSKRISSLEQRLKIKLLNRTTRALDMTEAGRVLYQKTEGTYKNLRDALTAVLDTQDAIRGKLRLSAPTNYCNLVLAPIIAEFCRQQPDIKIILDINDAKTLPPFSEYDLAIRAGDIPNSNVIMRPLTTVKFLTVATPRYLKQHGIPQTPKDLLKHRCVDYQNRQPSAAWKFYKGNKSCVIPINSHITTNNPVFIKYAIMADAGIGYLPCFIAADAIKRGDLTAILTEYESQSLEVKLFYPYPKAQLPKKVSLFIDFLMENVRLNSENHSETIAAA